jgi:hypothetical protein
MPKHLAEGDLNIIAPPVVRQTLGQPDPFRLRYRQQLIEIIGEVVRQKLIGQDIPIFIEHWSKDNLPKEDQSHFVTIAAENRGTRYPANSSCCGASGPA